MTNPVREHACVFGLSWGDEGKGKVVDLLCPAYDIVVRFNGGANAGHTVCVGDEHFALHLLPTGVLRKGAMGVIGPGVVVDPIKLLEEIDSLAKRGIDVSGSLKLSDRAHLVLAYHKLEDQLGESAAADSARIGTTARGIGPCYADKMRRTTAVRVADLLYDNELPSRVTGIITQRKAMLRALYGSDGGLDADALLADLALATERLAPLACDTTAYLHDAVGAGKAILFEGANGMLLDVDHGTYPYVTSSSTGPHGIGAGAGVPPSWVTRLVGTTKAYSTRVGSGPFVTELEGPLGERIRRSGNEYGTTTGRPRRCGWLDAVACRYTAMLSGATDLALMHLDTLTGFEQIGICTAYRCDDRVLTVPPPFSPLLSRSSGVIEMMAGWRQELSNVRRFDDLPANARDYIERIESLVGLPVSIIGVGPERSQTVLRGAFLESVSRPEHSHV